MTILKFRGELYYISLLRVMVLLLRVHGKSADSCAALKYPSAHGHSVTAASTALVLGGQPRQPLETREDKY